MTRIEQYCTFTIGGLHLGVPVQGVQEVIRYQELTRVPLAAAEVRGLINLRGQIVTAVDLRRKLGLGERADEERPTNVVLRRDDGAVSLLVDEIGDVLEVSEDSWEPAPRTLKGGARDLISGVYKLDKGLLLVLDADKALAVEGRSEVA
jgi:purine-binding chemotaxis protein CheW